MFARIKKHFYNKFELEEKKEKLENNNNNNSKKDNDLTVTAKKGIPASRKKWLIISAIFVVILLGILIPVIVDAVKPKPTFINNIVKIEQNASTPDNKYDFNIDFNGDENKHKTAVLDLSPFVSTAYFRTSNNFEIFAPLTGTNGNSAGAKINVCKNYDGTYTLASINVSTIDAQLFQSLNSLTTNANFKPEGINWLSVISLLLPLLIFIFMIISYVRMSKLQGGGQESIFGIGKSGATIAKSNVLFSDVAGIKEEKNELLEIVDYLKNPKKYADMGARTPRGVMLYGPPGTGKTLLAKATAGEAGVNFFQISGSQFEDMLVGVGAKRVRDLFQKARKSSPAIIFIDEIDSVASKRGKNEFGGGLADQTINQLLAEMDGFNTSTGIVVMAATNRLDVLDDAILRPGRFDRHIQVNLPDIKEREEILKIHARNKNISKKVSFNDIARRTPGFSGAQLENVLNEATLLAVRENQTVINEKDIDEAIDRVIAGPAKHSRVISDEEKKLIAYHEAGHALVGLHTPGTDIVQKITIIPRGQAAGYTMQTPEKVEQTIQKKTDLLNNIRMTLGGRAAEEIIYGKDSITTGASNDLYKVTNIVRAMVMQLGMSELGLTQFAPSEGTINPYQTKLFSDQMAQKIDNEIEKIIQVEYNNAKKIIKENKKELDLIVETLLLLETILKEQIDFIHKYKKLPKEAEEMKAKNKDKKTESKDEESKQETNKTEVIDNKGEKNEKN